ncbi:MAG: hypothetical protein AAGF12_07200, partial [Myxococcota bacterium]
AALDLGGLGSRKQQLLRRVVGHGPSQLHGFCYVPGEIIREDPVPQVEAETVELARAVTYDAAQELLFATPQTTEVESGAPVFSEIAAFDSVTGDELIFRSLNDPGFAAGGLDMLAFPNFLAGAGSSLHQINFETGDKQQVLDLSSLGIGSIEGLEIDQENGRVYVVDGRNLELHTLDLAEVEAAIAR